MGIFAADRLEIEPVNTPLRDHHDINGAFQDMWMGPEDLSNPAFYLVSFHRITDLFTDGDTDAAVWSGSRFNVVDEPMAPCSVTASLRDEEVSTLEEP
jgi:hypothetical protein